ncbi:MAG: hypothetical protein KAX78_09745 [Phycisphaerae bacterium]|nr:hypothetical protein [Phycisphaerae bacterium]
MFICECFRALFELRETNPPLNIFPLVGCGTVEEFQDNLGALDGAKFAPCLQ